jgi:hypothetical protein
MWRRMCSTVNVVGARCGDGHGRADATLMLHSHFTTQPLGVCQHIEYPSQGRWIVCMLVLEGQQHRYCYSSVCLRRTPRACDESERGETGKTGCWEMGTGRQEMILEYILSYRPW